MREYTVESFLQHLRWRKSDRHSRDMAFGIPHSETVVDLFYQYSRLKYLAASIRPYLKQKFATGSRDLRKNISSEEPQSNPRIPSAASNMISVLKKRLSRGSLVFQSTPALSKARGTKNFQDESKVPFAQSDVDKVPLKQVHGNTDAGTLSGSYGFFSDENVNRRTVSYNTNYHPTTTSSSESRSFKTTKSSIVSGFRDDKDDVVSPKKTCSPREFSPTSELSEHDAVSDKDCCRGLEDASPSRLGRFDFETSLDHSHINRSLEESDLGMTAKRLLEALSHALETPQSFEHPQERHEDYIVNSSAKHMTCPGYDTNTKIVKQDPVSYEVSDPVQANLARAGSNSSVHLYNMRISRHLRSFSNFSYQSTSSSVPNEASKTSRLPCAANNEEQQDADTHELLPARDPNSFTVSHQAPAFIDLRGHLKTRQHAEYAQHHTDTEPHLAVTAAGKGSRREILEAALKKKEPAVAEQRSANKNSESLQKLKRRVSSGVGSLRHPHMAIAARLARRSTIESRLAANVEDVKGKENVEAIPSSEFSLIQVQDNLDGPSDHAQPTDCSHSNTHVITQDSVGHNYEQVSAVWEKALRTHQEDQLKPHTRRGSSVSSTSGKSNRGTRKSPRGSEVSNEVAVEASSSTVIAQIPTLELRKLNTSHSFDRLIIRGTTAVNSPKLAAQFESDLETRRVPTKEGRIRASSQPASETKTSSKSSHYLLPPRFSAEGRLSPDTGRLSESFPQREMSLKHRGPRKLSDLRAWSRYPSHTRKERNGPVGEADNVIVRDFQHVAAHGNASNNGGANVENARSSKRANWISKAKVLEEKLLAEVSAFFKHRTGSSFRVHEHAHRSPISIGGVLEYPELELLPRIKPEIEPAPKRPNQDSTSDKGQDSQWARDPTTAEPICAPRNRLGSSNYDDKPTEGSQMSNSSTKGTTIADWAEVYGPCVQGEPSSCLADLAPLRAEQNAHSRVAFLRTQQELSNLPVNSPPRNNDRIVRSASTDVMRRSSQNLYRKLEELEHLEVPQALKAAREAFN